MVVGEAPDFVGLHVSHFHSPHGLGKELLALDTGSHSSGDDRVAVNVKQPLGATDARAFQQVSQTINSLVERQSHRAERSRFEAGAVTYAALPALVAVAVPPEASGRLTAGGPAAHEKPVPFSGWLRYNAVVRAVFRPTRLSVSCSRACYQQARGFLFLPIIVRTFIVHVKALDRPLYCPYNSRVVWPELKREQNMTVHDLAEELRARCEAYLANNPAKFKAEERDIIRRQNQQSTDEQIIDSYITCNACGQKWLRGSALDVAIANAKSAEHFLRSVPHSCHDN